MRFHSVLLVEKLVGSADPLGLDYRQVRLDTIVCLVEQFMQKMGMGVELGDIFSHRAIDPVPGKFSTRIDGRLTDWATVMPRGAISHRTREHPVQRAASSSMACPESGWRVSFQSPDQLREYRKSRAELCSRPTSTTIWW